MPRDTRMRYGCGWPDDVSKGVKRKPKPAVPVDVQREPAMALHVGRNADSYSMPATYVEGWRDAEAYHGITAKGAKS